MASVGTYVFAGLNLYLAVDAAEHSAEHRSPFDFTVDKFHFAGNVSLEDTPDGVHLFGVRDAAFLAMTLYADAAGLGTPGATVPLLIGIVSHGKEWAVRGTITRKGKAKPKVGGSV